IMSSDSSSSSGQRWCICRSTDTGRFMIGCDKCEEWFHGDCIGVTPKQADAMRNYYCRRCLKRHPSLRIVWKTADPGDESASSGPAGSSTRQMPPQAHQQQQTSSRSSAGPPAAAPGPQSRGQAKQPKQQLQRRRRVQQQQQRPSPSPAAASTSTGAARVQISERAGARRQCEGPACRRVALRGSAYCGKACGLERAKRRLIDLLPARLAAWQARVPVAERRDSLRLSRVVQAADAAKRRLTDGELRHRALDQLLARGRRQLRGGVIEEPGPPGEDDVTVPCPSCSQETPVRSALRHLLKCQQRIESRTSFGAPYPSQMDGTPLFCDRYCPASRAYCKKLAVLCPDHYRPDASETGDACGCPLTDDELAGPLCPVARQKCTRHFAWARMRRAEIDIDRMRQLMRLEELLFEERAIRQAMMQRGGAVSLLLHSTIDHQPGFNLPVVEAPSIGLRVPPNHIL
ncbi:hypothetical protein BOX15_Mlig025553g1, partial [Macrostomum lignano]